MRRTMKRTRMLPMTTTTRSQLGVAGEVRATVRVSAEVPLAMTKRTKRKREATQQL